MACSIYFFSLAWPTRSHLTEDFLSRVSALQVFTLPQVLLSSRGWSLFFPQYWQLFLAFFFLVFFLAVCAPPLTPLWGFSHWCFTLEILESSFMSYTCWLMSSVWLASSRNRSSVYLFWMLFLIRTLSLMVCISCLKILCSVWLLNAQSFNCLLA